MSTLVKLLLALVIQLTGPGEIPNADATTTTKTIESRCSLEDLNPDYIITRDEYLSYKKEAAI